MSFCLGSLCGASSWWTSLCWALLCWASLCWASLCWASLCGHHYTDYHYAERRVFLFWHVSLCWVSFLLCWVLCRPGAYPRVTPFSRCFNKVAYGLTRKYWTSLERLARDKHSSLLQKSINEGFKKLYNFGPCSQTWSCWWILDLATETHTY